MFGTRPPMHGLGSRCSARLADLMSDGTAMVWLRVSDRLREPPEAYKPPAPLKYTVRSRRRPTLVPEVIEASIDDGGPVRADIERPPSRRTVLWSAKR